jgi:hypothetical protein
MMRFEPFLPDSECAFTVVNPATIFTSGDFFALLVKLTWSALVAGFLFWLFNRGMRMILQKCDNAYHEHNQNQPGWDTLEVHFGGQAQMLTIHRETVVKRRVKSRLRSGWTRLKLYGIYRLHDTLRRNLDPSAYPISGHLSTALDRSQFDDALTEILNRDCTAFGFLAPLHARVLGFAVLYHNRDKGPYPSSICLAFAYSVFLIPWLTALTLTHELGHIAQELGDHSIANDGFGEMSLCKRLFVIEFIAGLATPVVILIIVGAVSLIFVSFTVLVESGYFLILFGTLFVVWLSLFYLSKRHVRRIFSNANGRSK